MCLKMSSARWRPFCPGGDELICESQLNNTEHFHDAAIDKVGILKFLVFFVIFCLLST